VQTSIPLLTVRSLRVWVDEKTFHILSVSHSSHKMLNSDVCNIEFSVVEHVVTTIEVPNELEPQFPEIDVEVKEQLIFEARMVRAEEGPASYVLGVCKKSVHAALIPFLPSGLHYFAKDIYPETSPE
jgi:hypothetical protein